MFKKMKYINEYKEEMIKKEANRLAKEISNKMKKTAYIEFIDGKIWLLGFFEDEDYSEIIKENLEYADISYYFPISELDKLMNAEEVIKLSGHAMKNYNVELSLIRNHIRLVELCNNKYYKKDVHRVQMVKDIF